MITEDTLDSAATTSELSDSSSSESPDSSLDDQQSGTELAEKLAASEAESEKLRNEVKVWRGRTEKANEKKATPISEEELDWKLANNPRIELVKDSYQKHLDELQGLGAKLSPALKSKALKIAEDELGVSKATQDSDNSLPASTVDRGGQAPVKMTDYDRAMGVKPETKAKYREYVEG